MHPPLPKASVHKANGLLVKTILTMNNRELPEGEKVRVAKIIWEERQKGKNFLRKIK